MQCALAGRVFPLSSRASLSALLAACGMFVVGCGDDTGPASGPIASAGAAGSSAGASGASGASGSSGSGGATTDAGTEPGTTPRLLWDMTGIIGTGQSLAVGAQATQIVATQPSFSNLKLALNGATVPPFDPDAAALSLVPLVEPIRPTATTYPSAYPANIYGESFHTAMASQITQMAQQAGAQDYVTVHTVVGESGQGMNVINKAAVETVVGATTTGRAYAASLFEATAIERLATTQSKTYGIGAIFLTHGETDSGNPGYEDAMLQLAADYNTDLRAISGQTEPILLFTSQQNALGFSAGARSGFSPATAAEWKIGVNHPEQAVCTGPKYQYPYFTDNLHLVTRGYELLGEKYGEIYFQKVVLGNDWKPLQPTTVEHVGAVVTVHFEVPVPPLAWDEALPAPFQGTLLGEWANGRGFEVRMGQTPIAISSVEIVDEAVRITCAADVPAGAIVAYAASSDGVALPGVSVRRGQLKDSDALVGALTAEVQANYAVAFELPVP